MLVIQVDMLCVLFLRLLMRDLLVKCGDTCHTVRFVNVLHNCPALHFLFQTNSYIFNTNLNPL
jgi:hypothetical protein